MPSRLATSLYCGGLGRAAVKKRRLRVLGGIPVVSVVGIEPTYTD